MSDDIAIKVDGVYKDFKLPHQKVNSVKSLFTSVAKKKVKSFETQHALKDISFEVKKGEFFGIVGRNGSGKSTLLKIIAEIYQPTKGTLQKSGKLVPFIELGVGFNPELTGRENVYLNGALLGFTIKEIDAQYDQIVEFAELEQFMDQKLKNYSSGMQVRLAFSVATRAKADILLIDEVLAVGDSDFQRKCFNYFKQLKGSDTTVVFVSHDMDAVREYCDRAVLVEKSRTVDVGEPGKIASLYSKLFIDEEKTELQEQEDSKWGDGSADITNVQTKVSIDRVTISYDVRVNSDIKNGIFGFSMRDGSGVGLVGTNSKLNKSGELNLVAGEACNISFTFDNVFNDGDYTFDAAIMDEDGVSIKCWWQNAAKITIKKPVRLPTVLNYKIAVEVRDIK